MSNNKLMIMPNGIGEYSLNIDNVNRFKGDEGGFNYSLPVNTESIIKNKHPFICFKLWNNGKWKECLEFLNNKNDYSFMLTKEDWKICKDVIQQKDNIFYVPHPLNQ